MIRTIISNTIVLLLCGLSCSLLFGPPEFEIDATKCTDFSDLVTFELEEYGNNIVGIDTTDFTLRGHIRYDKDRSVGGAQAAAFRKRNNLRVIFRLFRRDSSLCCFGDDGIFVLLSPCVLS